MKTLKEAMCLLSLKEQKDILEGLLKELQNIAEEHKENLTSLSLTEKDLFKQKIINKLLSCNIDDESFEKLKQLK